MTFRLALTATAILLAFGLPLAAWLTYGKSRMRPVVQTLVSLPLVLPPTVLGFYLLVLLGPTTAVGRMIMRILGHPLAFSFAGLLIGSMLYSLPFAIQPLVSGMMAVDPALREAAATLGASPMRVFREITLPLIRPSILTATILAFTHTVGEFGVVLMLGGNIPGATRTLSIALYDQVADFNFAEANRTALLLLVISFTSLLLVNWRAGQRSTRLV
ncbi:molybdate ABC transporter permease subunit [Terriglobus tenax]|uniref:molybdate ABC transporter permease subunit n=1 Tax=Terriglobus tenax TaxID=1111115 RepID=UPI00295A803C|nr:molybdate ABC transporter permease subunit [Terriglobus tenax]